MGCFSATNGAITRKIVVIARVVVVAIPFVQQLTFELLC